eukprot:gene169-781_t
MSKNQVDDFILRARFIFAYGFIYLNVQILCLEDRWMKILGLEDRWMRMVEASVKF